MTSLSVNTNHDASTQSYTLTVEKPQEIGVSAYEERLLEANEVRIKTLLSGISAGTEMTAFMGSNPYLHKKWDPELLLFVDGASSIEYPWDAIGYEEVGEIIEVGSDVTELKIGQLIWGYWGHKTSAIQKEDWAKERVLASGLDPICGIFSQIGAISLNAILDADIHLGEYVAVFGQGVPGLMVTQLAKASGAVVIAVDRLDSRLEAAKASGADYAINSKNVNAAEAIREITGGRGADVAIEITGSYHALQDAVRAVAYNSRVIVSGFFQGEGKGLRLGEEFHHNRIQLICSQIGGASTTADHRWDILRLNQTVMRLQEQKQVDFTKLVSHTFAAKEAQKAFDMLRDTPNDVLQIVLDFRE